MPFWQLAYNNSSYKHSKPGPSRTHSSNDMFLAENGRHITDEPTLVELPGLCKVAAERPATVARVASYGKTPHHWVSDTAQRWQQHRSYFYCFAFITSILFFSVCLSSLSLTYHGPSAATTTRSRKPQIPGERCLLGAFLVCMSGICKGQD